MYEPLKFKRMKEIAAELAEKLDQLEVGSLSKEHLENLTEQSRELYERLVVLRFKAYDRTIKENEESKTATAETEKPELNTPISFSLDTTKTDAPPQPIQVSLIDAIQEETAKQAVAESEAMKETFSEAKTEITPEKIITPAQPVANTSTQTPLSLYDKLTKNISVAETIAERSEHLPIADLKKAISLNQRFQFSKELFKGNNQEYEVTIERLNNANREDAMKQLDQLKSKYSWTPDAAVTLDFIDLVTRRHLA